MTRRLSGLALLVAMVVPIVLYLPTLRFGFVFDDRPLLIDNPIVRSPRGLAEIFTTDLDPGARTSESPATNYLRPLFIALASGLHRLFAEDPRGWHATAIGLHAVLVGMAFLLLRLEVKGVATALAAALFFALHPTHAQSTAWVSGLQDLLFGVTALGAFMAYRYSLRQRVPSLPAMTLLAGAFAASLLAKEPAIGLLLFVAAEAIGWVAAAPDEGTTVRRPVAEFLLLLGVVGLYFVYRVAVLGEIAHSFPTAPGWPEALASIPVALLAYTADVVWPVDLFLLHPARPVSGVLTRASLLAALGVMGIAIFARIAVVRRPILSRPFAWIAAWLAPTLAIWAVNPEWMVMDRYLLLPTLGVGWALALVLPLGSPAPLARTAAWIALLVAEAALSTAAMRPFENEDRFWSTAIRADPRSSTAWTEWARKRSEAGDLEAAEAALQRAAELDPRAQLPRLRQALLALRIGRSGDAAATLSDLIDRNPGYLPAWRNLVVALARSGDPQAASRKLSDALERFPKDPLLWTQRAILLRQEGRIEEALVAVRRAMALAPHDPDLALREDQLLAQLGR